MRDEKRLDAVGLFPPIGEGAVGGIEAVGRVAWSTIVASSPGMNYLISYGPGQSEHEDRSGVATSRRAKAFLAAASVALRARRALVWHLGLSPLLPLFVSCRRHAAVYLHGVEAWRAIPRPQRVALLWARPLLLTHVQLTLDRFLEANPWARALPARVVTPGVGMPTGVPIRPPSDTPAAVMIGRLVRGEAYKGHREVITAWPAVLAAMPNAELWIVGDGDLRSDLEAIAATTGVADQVRFFGRIDNESRDALIVAARCMALPSGGEGFGIVYLEAMRLGRPCLVSTLDSGKTVVAPPEGGLAVDPADTGQLARALIRLMTPGNEWDAWSLAAKDRYEANFTEAAFRDRLLAAWRLVGTGG